MFCDFLRRTPGHQLPGVGQTAGELDERPVESCRNDCDKILSAKKFSVL